MSSRRQPNTEEGEDICHTRRLPVIPGNFDEIAVRRLLAVISEPLSIPLTFILLDHWKTTYVTAEE